MLPNEFKPENEYDLIRLGQDNDGGYLVERKSINDSKSLTNSSLKASGMPSLIKDSLRSLINIIFSVEVFDSKIP